MWLWTSSASVDGESFNSSRDWSHDLSHDAHRGHNEMDNPRLTQPTMYSVIDERPTVPDLYAGELEVYTFVCFEAMCLTSDRTIFNLAV